MGIERRMEKTEKNTAVRKGVVEGVKRGQGGTGRKGLGEMERDGRDREGRSGESLGME